MIYFVILGSVFNFQVVLIHFAGRNRLFFSFFDEKIRNSTIFRQNSHRLAKNNIDYNRLLFCACSIFKRKGVGGLKRTVARTCYSRKQIFVKFPVKTHLLQPTVLMSVLEPQIFDYIPKNLTKSGKCSLAFFRKSCRKNPKL